MKLLIQRNKSFTHWFTLSRRNPRQPLLSEIVSLSAYQVGLLITYDKLFQNKDINCDVIKTKYIITYFILINRRFSLHIFLQRLAYDHIRLD